MRDWQEIIEREGQGVWQTAYRLVANRADADDCFQEAFLAALEISRREHVENWRALLRRLATARAVDRLRRRRRWLSRQSALDCDTLAGPGAEPAQLVEDAELSDRLRRALARLPARQANVFCLHALDGWSYQEVAAHLKISVDSVGVVLFRARRRLRELLDLPDSPRLARSNALVAPRTPIEPGKEAR
jgi:RNA polymerase sigma-70 factor, ECF subfamily